MYDVTNEKSFQNIRDYVMDIKQVSKTILLCNVCCNLNV